MALTLEEYSNDKNWSDVFPDKIDIRILKYGSSWKKLFEKLFEMKKTVRNINERLTEDLKHGKQIFPFPNYVFNAFKHTSREELKVVIIGQDCYFDNEYYKGKCCPQAHGLSFSVPIKIKIPSSLNNIYANLLKFNHIEEKPSHGNLENWAKQGVLLLNSALTVPYKEKEEHLQTWEKFTDRIIKYISKKHKNIVFVLFGSHALKKKELIDEKKHLAIVTSHPSGLSNNKKLGIYPSFNSNDTFGVINKYLNENKIKEIDWNV